jgi:hypothetical protein
MSSKIMGLVWDADIPQNLKFVLLAYADHADHEGNNVFPSVALIVHKTGYTDRQVQRITADLVEAGLMTPQGESSYGTNAYSISVEALEARKKPPAHLQKRGRPAKKGDKMSPLIQKNGDISAPNFAENGDIAMSPEPSLIKPSTSRENKDSYSDFVKSLSRQYPQLTFMGISQAERLDELFQEHGPERLRAIADWMSTSDMRLTSMPQYLSFCEKRAASWGDGPPAPREKAPDEYRREAERYGLVTGPDTGGGDFDDADDYDDYDDLPEEPPAPRPQPKPKREPDTWDRLVDQIITNYSVPRHSQFGKLLLSGRLVGISDGTMTVAVDDPQLAAARFGSIANNYAPALNGGSIARVAFVGAG